MSEELVVKHCAPTLAGLKTANMFSVEYSSKEEINHEIRSLNKLLASKGLRVMPLSYRGGRALIYIYRPDSLKRDLADNMAAGLLSKLGYTPVSPERCLVRLINRIGGSSDFPHEIGLFLGYPAADVLGFINDRGACKLSGCWKVYSDEEGAIKTFRRYKQCTRAYCRQVKLGHSLRELAVAI